MKNRQDMTYEEHLRQDARESAARAYRAEGYDDFATEVERGKHDECQMMRLAKFFIEPTPPHDPAFIAAWDKLTGRTVA